MALVEKRGHLGGNACINTGCTPTKNDDRFSPGGSLRSQRRKVGHSFGCHLRVDLPAIVERKREVVQKFRDGQQRKVDERPNLSLVKGRARFISPKQIQVGAEILESEKFFINTGTRPAVLAIPGMDSVSILNNESIMELQVLPERLLILGGGYIGLEFGQMFRRFGCEVKIVNSGPRIMPREDEDVSAAMQKILEAEGITFELNANTVRAESGGGEITLTTESGATAEGSRHLCCGRDRALVPIPTISAWTSAGVRVGCQGIYQNEWANGDGRPGYLGAGRRERRSGFHAHFHFNDYQILYGNIIEGKNLSIENRYVPLRAFHRSATGPRRPHGECRARLRTEAENRFVADDGCFARR